MKLMTKGENKTITMKLMAIQVKIHIEIKIIVISEEN